MSLHKVKRSGFGLLNPPVEEKVQEFGQLLKMLRIVGLWINCYCGYCLVARSCLALSRPHGLQPTRLLCPWDFQARVLEWGTVAFSDYSLRDMLPSRPCGGLVRRALLSAALYRREAEARREVHCLGPTAGWWGRNSDPHMVPFGRSSP